MTTRISNAKFAKFAKAAADSLDCVTPGCFFNNQSIDLYAGADGEEKRYFVVFNNLRSVMLFMR
jgi:hypothetical protein